jgi:hypothetical protein
MDIYMNGIIFYPITKHQNPALQNREYSDTYTRHDGHIIDTEKK